MSNGESSRAIHISTLKNLDNLLKCGICYEYLKTTLITPCSHNYCSYCIRRSLMYKAQCPLCFEETTDSQLRNNRVLDEVVAIFSSVKDTLLWCLNSQYAKRNLFENSSVAVESSDRIRNSVAPINRCETPPPTVVERPPENPPSNSSSSTSSASNNVNTQKDVRIPSMFSPKKQKVTNVEIPKVSCPVCEVEIPERNINIHLDACLKRSQEKCVSINERRKPLPKLVYTLVKEKELRKKLSDLGLSSLGDRNTLINRHKRYTLLYNSECDSQSPRPVSEIVKQQKKEEEEEKKVASQSAPVLKLNVDRKADPKANEEAQRQYLEEHKSSFQKLIESIQRNKQIKKVSKSEVDIVDDLPKKKAIEVISVDETSTSSEHSKAETLINRVPKSKRKRIVSESEESSEEMLEVPTMGEKIKVEASVHSPRVKENSLSPEIKGRKSIKDAKPSKLLGANETISSHDSNEDLTFLTEMLDNVSKDSSDTECINGFITPVRGRPSRASTTLSSPVLGSRCTINTSPSTSSANKRERERENTPDIFEDLEVLKTEGKSKEYSLDDCDTSNDSVSLMVYEGSDVISQSTVQKCLSPVVRTNPEILKREMTFSLGIDSILPESEDFLKTPVRRERTRTRERSTDVVPPSRRSLRNRLKK